MLNLVYHIDKQVEKPKEDISMATSYDQRYLEMISKIFYKELEGWNCRRGYDLNDILGRGGKIAIFWRRMRLVGAVVWSGEADTWQLEHMAFKFKEQRRGSGKILLDYVLYQIGLAGESGDSPQEQGTVPLLHASVAEGSAAELFLRKYGFTGENE